MKKILVTTSNFIEGGKIISYLDIVNANVVIGNNILSEMFASFSDIFGGRSGRYQNNLDSLYDYAMKELREKAVERGANAIIGVKMDFSEITGKGKDMFMLSAIGTAVKIDYLTPELLGEVEVLTEREKEIAAKRKIAVEAQKSLSHDENYKPSISELENDNTFLEETKNVMKERGRKETIQFLRSKGFDFSQAVGYLSNNFPEE